MSNEEKHTREDQEIREALDELNFITFCEAILKETKSQEKFYQVEIKESRLYKLWHTTGENSNEQQAKLER